MRDVLPKTLTLTVTLTLTLTLSAAARHALTSAAELLSPLALTQLPQLLYPCSHSYCQTRRLLLTLTLTLILIGGMQPEKWLV